VQPPDYRLNREITAADEANRDLQLKRVRGLKQSGRLLSIAEAGWDLARRAWNLAVDQRPRHVAFPDTTEDVVALVAFARSRGLKIVPQGTGHGAAPVDRIEDSILVRPTHMRSVEVDPVRGSMKVGAGVTWAEAQAASSAHGLAGLAGSSPDVGVLGYTVSGGLGWLGRSHGLACNSVISFDVVTADGRSVVVDATREQDLFWALRGGGGSFGIVTGVEFSLYPAKELYAGSLFWPQERSAEVLHAWRDWVATLPDSVTSIGRLLALPADPSIAEHLRGRSFVLVEVACLASEAEGRDLLRPLRALGPSMDTVAMLSPTGLLAIHMDPPGPVPVSLDGWMLSDLSADAIEPLVRAAGPGSGSALRSFEIRHLGGQLGLESPGHGALASLEGRFATAAIGIIPTQESAAAVERSTIAVRAALEPWLAERRFANFARPDAPLHEFHSPETLARLRQVKTRYDPDDLIRSARPVGVA
jgi:FAD/FMN-containing dehydrogenase